MKEGYNNVGKQVRHLRLKRGWSQEHLAKISGMHQSSISNLESGLRPPTIKTLIKVAVALGKEIKLV